MALSALRSLQTDPERKVCNGKELVCAVSPDAGLLDVQAPDTKIKAGEHGRMEKVTVTPEMTELEQGWNNGTEQGRKWNKTERNKEAEQDPEQGRNKKEQDPEQGRNKNKEQGGANEAEQGAEQGRNKTVDAKEKKDKGERIKHDVNVKHHFVTETVKRGEVVLKWIPITEQQADILTKVLAEPMFANFASSSCRAKVSACEYA